MSSALAPSPSLRDPIVQAQSAGPSVRISEFHYDNPGTDVGGSEKIEISAPAGTNLAGWQVVRFNGATASAAIIYPSPAGITVTGVVPQSCGTRGVLAFTYPVQDGLQNGPNDGFALVNPANQVIELLSYEGVFTVSSTSTVAAGMTSTDVGVSESPAATDPLTSIKRQPDGTWIKSTPQSFGTCNDDDSGTSQPVDHITVTPASASITQGSTQQYTATAFDASNQPIAGTSFTWGTSASAVATVSSSGLATGAGAGDANITATSGSIVGTATIHVDAAVIDHIVIAPVDVTITQGATQQFTATAYDASNTAINGTTFTWGSSNTAVATVNGSGLATGVAGGDANITATSGSVVGTGVLHVTGAAPYTPPNIRISELHYDNTGTDAGEAVEIEGPVGASLAGWSIAFYNGDPASATTALKVYMTTPLTGSLVAPVACNARGALTFAISGIQNGGLNGSQPDGLALVDNNGALVEFLSYEGSFTAADGPALGVTSRDMVVMEDNPTPAAAPVASLKRSADGMTWTGPSANNFDYVNACGAPPPPQFSITFSGRATPADPPLPVGFEAQVFATEKNGNATVSTTFTWSSDTPAIASVDNDGVFRALTAGTAVLRATAADGTTGTISLPTVVGTQSGAPYGGNTEFGDPVDGDASNDFIIRRAEYTSSFNHLLGRPNWVSAKLDASAYGPEDRCNCFTFDPELVAAGFTPYTTADYTGAGAFATYGIDRGHMTRSADRTAGNLDNARTYYFSNVLPQAAANNQVTWKLLEDTLGTIAQNQGKEVYTVMGGSNSAAYPSRGFIKGQNKVEMPGAVWKVAVILPHGQGLADVHRASDVQIIAVIMPNDPGISTDWHAFKTTVDAVEALSGYDLLSLLPDNIETAVESGDAQPFARLTGPTTGNEGSTLAFDASTSTDADAGDALTYAWTFGDGGTATGATASHTYADNGTYTVTMTVTDSHGVYDVATQTVTVGNVAPTATFNAPAGPLVEGSSFSLSLAGAADASSVDQSSLTYAFDCGAGYGAASSTNTATCTATDDPSSAVKGKVIDKDGGFTEYTASVPVTNAAPVISSFTAGPTLAASGTTVTATVNFSDVGPVDTHTAVITWGDGTSSTVNAGLATQAVATHAYAGAGFYTIGVTVTDDDNGSATATTAVTMYDAAAGSIEAKGKVDGPTSAPNDKANFEISLRYTGGSTPVGTFKIIGAAGIKNMNAASTFDWLVVVGNTATFTGTGVLTDGTQVRFLVSGVDMSSTPSHPSDRMRLKVTDAVTGAVLYDTQPGAADLAAPTSAVTNGSFAITH